MTDLHPILTALRAYNYTWMTEAQLQAGVAEALTRAGMQPAREHDLPGAGRVDLYLPATRVAIEVKIDGGQGEVMRQVARYAGHPDVSGVILVTTRPARHAALPESLAGKPIAIYGVMAL